MYAFLLQLDYLFLQDSLKFYLIFFSIHWILWFLRILFALRYQPKFEPYSPDFTVLVPVYHEKPELLDACLSSIKEISPTELIVVIDGAESQNLELVPIAERYADQVITKPKREGKRHALVTAVEAITKDSEVIVTVDSDTTWTKYTKNILMPFKDPEVGGVVGRQSVQNRDKNITRRVADWLEDNRFTLQIPAQASFGTVTTMPGRTLAVRREVYEKGIKVIAAEKFLGREMVTGDDRSITSQVLRQGYKTVYQPNSLVLTDAPDTVGGFWNQYLRWYRNAYRGTILNIWMYFRRAPLVAIWALNFTLSNILFLGLIFAAILKWGFRLYEIIPVENTIIPVETVGHHILFTLLGLIFLYYLRQLPHLIHFRRDVLFLPVFSLYLLLLMVPLKAMAILTFFEQGWNTRGKNGRNKLLKRHILLTRGFAVSTGVIAYLLLFPAAYNFDIAPFEVPLNYVVAQAGPEYYRAREIVNSFSDEQVAGISTELEAEVYDLVGTVARVEGIQIDSEQQSLATECVFSRAVGSNDGFGIYTTCLKAL